MGEANSAKISLKLLVDRNSYRVIIGEAGKDSVDFLFHLVSIPVGTVVKHLSKDKMVGSLGNIYKSIEAMPVNYMEPNLNKAHVLNPKVSSSSLADTPFLLAEKTNDDEPNVPEVLYQCEHYNKRQRTSKYPKAKGPHCSKEKKPKLTHVHNHVQAKKEVRVGNGSGSGYVKGIVKKEAKVGNGSGSGYVKGIVMYMVTDNLEVKPMSTISSITLLSTFEVKDLDALETMEVFIGKEEAVEILKASFITNRVLTSLFLGQQKP